MLLTQPRQLVLDVAGVSNWADSEVELAWTREAPNYLNECVDSKKQPERWRIDLTSGTARPIESAPAITVSLHTTPENRRMTITLPEGDRPGLEAIVLPKSAPPRTTSATHLAALKTAQCKQVGRKLSSTR